MDNINQIKPKPKYKKTYPPSYLQDELNKIKRIDDFDLMMERLDDFIYKNGLDHTRNSEILKHNISEGYANRSKYYYYNTVSITEPLICKHYTNLITARYLDNSKKNTVFNNVIDKWGYLDGEHYYCKNCGEIIGHAKYSDWEGFGKNDSAIMIREVIEDEPENINDIVKDEISIIKQVINTMSKLCNIKLTNDDYILIVNIFKELQDAPSYKPLSFSDFYFQIFKKEHKLGNLINKIMIDIEEKNNGNVSLSLMIEYGNSFSSKDKKREAIIKNTFTKLIPAIYKGYVSYIKLKLLIGLFIEVYRTGIPEYPNCSTGAERLTKQKNKSSTVISDFYYNEEYAILFFIDKIHTQLANINFKDKNNSQEFAATKVYLQHTVGKEKDALKETLSTDINSIIKVLKNNTTINDREEKKQEYKIIQSLSEQKIDDQYKWKDFIPSLDFVTEYDYSTPNIDIILSKLNKNKSVIDNINDDLSPEKVLEKRDLIKTQNSLINKLDEIAYKIAFSLITKVNKINYTTELSREIYAKRWQSYTSALGYDYISKGYFEFYIKLNSSIKTDLDNLQKIYNVNIKSVNNSINQTLILINNTRTYDNLQKFMKFDDSLYKTQNEIRHVLINKLKAINYIYILTGPNAGKKRQFKTINDIDYKVLIDIYLKNPDVTEDEIREILSNKFNDNGLPKELIEFKLKIVNDYNGDAEIDIVNLEFKDDISKSIDELVKTKNEEEINKLINEFETNSSVNIYVNDDGVISDLVEIDNEDIEKNRLTEFIKNYFMIFSTDDENIDEIVAEMLKNDTNNYLKTTQFINDNIIGDNVINYRNSIAEIIYKHRPSLNKDHVEYVLSNMCTLDNVIDETEKSIEKLIKIEYSDNMDNTMSEIKFRRSILNEYKNNNIIHIQVSFIRYIILLLNKLYNGKNTEYKQDCYRLTNTVKKALNKDDFNDIVMINVETEDLLNTIITDIGGEDLEVLDKNKFIYINEFLDSITFYNSRYNTNNKKVKSFITNPEFMKTLVNTVIIYLLSELITDDTDTNNKLSPLLLHLFDYISDTCLVNTILNKNIEESIKKKRANENIKRKARFDKLDDEQKDVQRLMRRMNIGNIYEWDDDKNVSEQAEELLTSTTAVADEVVEDEGDADIDGIEMEGGDEPIVVAMGVVDYDIDYGNDGNDDEDEI